MQTDGGIACLKKCAARRRGDESLALQTLAEQGVRGLFKGMGAPLATVAFFNAVLFTTRGQMEQLLAHEDGKEPKNGQGCENPAISVAHDVLESHNSQLQCVI